MSVLTIPTLEVFEPLLEPMRYKGAYGGRSSGKSQFFADQSIEDALRFPGDAQEGLRIVCNRQIQKSLTQSVKALVEKKLSGFGLGEAHGFKVYRDCIKLPKDGLMIFQGLQDHTAESIKSLEGFHRSWTEEAQGVTATALMLLRPTIRWENERLGMESELWFSWNPRHKRDAVEMLRHRHSDEQMVIKANWSDNPLFPRVLEKERQLCLQTDPDNYEHIWEGDYRTATTGAYYSKQLAIAREQGRINDDVVLDPLMKVYAYWDIGGTSRKSDATAIWIQQHIGQKIKNIDYYEAVGQPLDAHMNWLRANGYDKAFCVLPHDGARHENIRTVTYEGALRAGGFAAETMPNQGSGAAMLRVKNVREHFHRMEFNKTRCQSGLDALSWYHAKIDEERGIDLGPVHDWASHGADAFGLACSNYKPPSNRIRDDYTPHSNPWGLS